MIYSWKETFHWSVLGRPTLGANYFYHLVGYWSLGTGDWLEITTLPTNENIEINPGWVSEAWDGILEAWDKIVEAWDGVSEAWDGVLENWDGFGSLKYEVSEVIDEVWEKWQNSSIGIMGLRPKNRNLKYMWCLLPQKWRSKFQNQNQDYFCLLIHIR